MTEVDKLLTGLNESEKIGLIKLLIKDLDWDRSRRDAISEMCSICGSIDIPCYCAPDFDE